MADSPKTFADLSNTMADSSMDDDSLNSTTSEGQTTIIEANDIKGETSEVNVDENAVQDTDDSASDESTLSADEETLTIVDSDEEPYSEELTGSKVSSPKDVFDVIESGATEGLPVEVVKDSGAGGEKAKTSATATVIAKPDIPQTLQQRVPLASCTPRAQRLYGNIRSPVAEYIKAVPTFKKPAVPRMRRFVPKINKPVDLRHIVSPVGQYINNKAGETQTAPKPLPDTVTVRKQTLEDEDPVDDLMVPEPTEEKWF